MAGNVLNALKNRYNGRSTVQETALELAQSSMELMRCNVQHLFDREIQNVVDKYIEVSEMLACFTLIFVALIFMIINIIANKIY